MANDEIAGPDWREVVRTGLDDTEGGEQFAAWSSDDEGDQRAEVPITLAGGVWRLRKPNGDLIVGQCADKRTRAAVKLKTSDTCTRWMGYSLIAKDRRDVRPDLLMLVVERYTATLPKLIRYGRDYLRAKTQREPSGNPAGFPSDDALMAACADALLILTYGRRRGLRSCGPTLRARDTQFGLRRGTYGRIRKAAFEVYLRRYREAVERFVTIYNWTPARYNVHGSGFPADSLWHPARPFIVKGGGLLVSAFGHNGEYEVGNRPAYHVVRRAA